MIRIKDITKVIPANIVEQVAVGSITVPTGRRYDVLEVNALIKSKSTVVVKIEGDEYLYLYDELNAKDTRRRVLNWSITAGTTIYVTANGVGATDTLEGIELTYDDVVA